MPSALLLPLLTCAVVLVVSGLAKLRAPRHLDRAFTSLRVPASLDVAWVRRLVPWGEVALGLWLLVATGVALVLVAFVVLVLFGVYLALVVRAERGSQEVECDCFGALGDQRVTRVTVARNVVLVLAAALTLVAAVRDVAFLPAALSSPGLWGWLLGTALVATVVGLVGRRSGPDRPAVEAGPATGPDGEYVRRALPAVQVLTEDGELVLVGEQAWTAARLLVFLSPGCGPCRRVAPLVAGWAAELDPVSVHAVLVAEPSALEDLPGLAGHVWFDPHGVTHRVLAPGTPSAVLVGTDGLLAGGPVRGEQEVRAFVDDVRGHLRAEVGPVRERAAVSDAR